MSLGNVQSAPVAYDYTSNAIRGNDLEVGRYYRLELVGGKGAPNAVVGSYYLVTDLSDKSTRTLVDTGTGGTFVADSTDIFSTN